jgi:tRNA pseudouridine38-40 synthase
MVRYFLEVAYSGQGYAGFQRQKNARTIQGEIDRALSILCKTEIRTTGSSRTDAGVHARQNFVHFDAPSILPAHFKYTINAILPRKIAVTAFFEVPEKAHARYNAISRSYRYRIYSDKDPFLQDYGYFYPYPLDIKVLNQAAALIQENRDFKAFCKRNAQVAQFDCRIAEATWQVSGDSVLEFRVTADRFLRGMVRGLVGTMLQVGSGKITLQEFSAIIRSGNNALSDFSAPPQGLFLEAVTYPSFLYPATSEKGA